MDRGIIENAFKIDVRMGDDAFLAFFSISIEILCFGNQKFSVQVLEALPANIFSAILWVNSRKKHSHIPKGVKTRERESESGCLQIDSPEKCTLENYSKSIFCSWMGTRNSTQPNWEALWLWDKLRHSCVVLLLVFFIFSHLLSDGKQMLAEILRELCL